MRDRIKHGQAQEPPVGNVDFDVLDRLSHAPDSEEILDQLYLNKHDRIQAGSSVIQAVLFFDKVIDKTEIHGSVDQPEDVVLRHQIIHREKGDLFPFKVGFFRHHGGIPPKTIKTAEKVCFK